MRKAAFLMTVLLWGIAAQGLEPSRFDDAISAPPSRPCPPMRYGGRAPASPGEKLTTLHRLQFKRYALCQPTAPASCRKLPLVQITADADAVG